MVKNYIFTIYKKNYFVTTTVVVLIHTFIALMSVGLATSDCEKNQNVHKTLKTIIYYEVEVKYN